MTQKRAKTSTEKGVPSSEDVYFITTIRPAPGTAEAHGIKERWFGTTRSLAEVRTDAETIFGHAGRLAQAAAKQTPVGLELDEITFSLGFDAGGKLGFIAEASVSASVEISFKRSEPGDAE